MIIMGIPCYFSKLIKKHPKILNKYTNNVAVQDFYLDCNSIIYDVVHAIEEKTDENIIKNVIYKLEEYINTISPSGMTMIAFDGVAPNAKLHQQRERRYKSYITNSIFTADNKWNTCQITPGTKFMKHIMEEIELHFTSNKKIIISTSNIPGEGEHKIFEKIRNKYNTGTTMVYGIDADLIMLCLSHKSYCEKIVLFRETPFFIKNINKNIEPNELYYIDMSELGKAIDTTLNKKDSELDYILLMFLLGNDFLPHFPALNIRTSGMDILINSYIFCKKNSPSFCLVNNIRNIEWHNLNILLNHLSADEREHIIQHEDKKLRQFNKSKCEETQLQNKYLNIPIDLKNKELCINVKTEGWEERYYWVLLNIDRDDNNFFINKICKNYYKTLLWTYMYYTTGCVDWTWTYDYSYPPLIRDLTKHKADIGSFKNNTKAIKPQEQLYYVVPPDSIHLLEKKEQTKKKNEFNTLNVQYEWSYCRYIWEGHISFIHTRPV
jgi:5'-3' exoribonuclease 1